MIPSLFLFIYMPTAGAADGGCRSSIQIASTDDAKTDKNTRVLNS